MEKVCLPVRSRPCMQTPLPNGQWCSHHALKGLCSVRQPKWCEQILKQAKWRDNRRGFWDVCGCNGVFGVNPWQDQFSKKHCNHANKVLHVWQRVLVWGCHHIETAIIATRLSGSIFFGHKVLRRSPPMVFLGRTMPVDSRHLNTAFAISSFSGPRQWDFAKTGGWLPVWMCVSGTAWFGVTTVDL